MGQQDTRADALVRQIGEVRTLNRRLELENAELRQIVADHAADLHMAREQSSATARELVDLRLRLGSRRYRLADKVLRPLERGRRLRGVPRRGTRGHPGIR